MQVAQVFEGRIHDDCKRVFLNGSAVLLLPVSVQDQ
ncbi:hypothetical protein T4E_11834 [Trichinella pseudospiralis]|uniref:Uncharacterized protein n=1 Tax=Trichinella pseudospiralis TaxID=6337 RepID=A0A0V0XFZ4_TRIPS|nr:hypothetical protein T4E_11834 [Trichinella pseudospiralis]